MKVCKLCGQTMSLYAVIDGKRHNLKSRRYCLECSPFGQHNTRRLSAPRTELSNSVLYESNCERCGKPVRYKQNSKYHRRYCSVQCGAGTTLHQKTLSEQLSGDRGVVSTNGQLLAGFRRHILELHHNTCDICGWNKPNPFTGLSILEIHHIDGDHTNNVLSNFGVVCPTCHAMTANYRSRNRGNGSDSTTKTQMRS